MNIPNHMRADIRDGMDPSIVFNVYCNLCGRSLGDYRFLSRAEERFDPDTAQCDEGECDEIEREPTEEELWDFNEQVRGKE